MNADRLEQLLERFTDQHVLVVGDYFLDKYLMLDRPLSETSLETGLEAFQVVKVHASPGAAGSVVNNLRALGVQVTALSVIGEDGEGYELRKALIAQGVDVSHLIEAADRFTPTYTKPMMAEADGHVHELNRIDTKNRTPMPEAIQDEIIKQLQSLAPTVDAIIVADQVEEEECGVITPKVRQALSDLGQAIDNDRPLIAIDSRQRIGMFRNVIIKPNAREAFGATGEMPPADGMVDPVKREMAGKTLQAHTGRPVFLTSGVDGIFVFTSDGVQHVPGIPVPGPLDIVGAGDSVMAGLVSALCSGASEVEAAWIGNLGASITVQQVGTTGTANRHQLRERNEEAKELFGQIG